MIINTLGHFCLLKNNVFHFSECKNTKNLIGSHTIGNCLDVSTSEKKVKLLAYSLHSVLLLCRLHNLPHIIYSLISNCWIYKKCCWMSDWTSSTVIFSAKIYMIKWEVKWYLFHEKYSILSSEIKPTCVSGTALYWRSRQENRSCLRSKWDQYNVNSAEHPNTAMPTKDLYKDKHNRHIDHTLTT